MEERKWLWQEFPVLVTRANSRKETTRLRETGQLTVSQQKLCQALVEYAQWRFEQGRPDAAGFPPHWYPFFLEIFSKEGLFYKLFKNSFLRQMARAEISPAYRLLDTCRICSGFHSARSETLPKKMFSVELPAAVRDIIRQEAIDLGVSQAEYVIAKALYPVDDRVIFRRGIAWIEGEALEEEQRIRARLAE